MPTRVHQKLVHEGNLIAEVTVSLIESDDAWAPYLSVEDARKLDDVRVALRNGDIATAAKLSRVYQLEPLTAA